MSCEAYQAAVKAEEKFTKWKEEQNVKECPKCDAPIEKVYGCNHIECTNCANHICWQCMASFTIGPEVYRHMQKEHGTFMALGEGWGEVEEDDDDEEEDEEDAALAHEIELAARDFPRLVRENGPRSMGGSHPHHHLLSLLRCPSTMHAWMTRSSRIYPR